MNIKKTIAFAVATLFAMNVNAQVNLPEVEIADAALKAKYETFRKEMTGMSEEMAPLVTRWRELQSDNSAAAQAAKAAIEVKADSIDNVMTKNMKRFIKENRNNELPAYVIAANYYNFNIDELREMLAPNTGYFNSPGLDRAKAHLQALEKRQPGKRFAELTMKNLEGKTVRLSDYVGKGKYVLVDFWASWCGPCRQEMPNVVKSYERFRGKGYEIVGVSFDQKEDAWKKAVGDLGMTWPQMSDLKGWECAAHDAYGVNSIPSNVLVGPDGVIVATDLRGQALLKKLEEVLGE